MWVALFCLFRYHLITFIRMFYCHKFKVHLAASFQLIVFIKAYPETTRVGGRYMCSWVLPAPNNGGLAPSGFCQLVVQRSLFTVQPTSSAYILQPIAEPTVEPTIQRLQRTIRVRESPGNETSRPWDHSICKWYVE